MSLPAEDRAELTVRFQEHCPRRPVWGRDPSEWVKAGTAAHSGLPVPEDLDMSPEAVAERLEALGLARDAGYDPRLKSLGLPRQPDSIRWRQWPSPSARDCLGVAGIQTFPLVRSVMTSEGRRPCLAAVVNLIGRAHTEPFPVASRSSR